MGTLRAAMVLALAGYWPTSLSAEPPGLEHIFPAGFARSSTNSASLGGKFEVWPPQLWTDCPGLILTAQTNRGDVQVEVRADAPLGAHLVRVFNPDGCSVPRIVLVTSATEVLESEPNDHYERAQSLTPPATVNGQLNKVGDVDSFAVRMQAGAWLDARLEAYTLGSKIDALLRLVDAEGVQQAWNHDFTSLDPRLVWRAGHTGTYVLQVMGFKYPADSEVRLTGGNGCVYRLFLQVGNAPLTAQRAEANVSPPLCSLTNTVPLTVPARISGTLQRVDEAHTFTFNAEKDQDLEILVQAGSLGSPLNPWVTLNEPGGKELARQEELRPFQDCHLDWRATNSGRLQVTIGNVLHRAGPDHFYMLSIRSVLPEYRATLAVSSTSIVHGETNEIKVSVTRLRGFSHPLTVFFQRLPWGLDAEEVPVPEKGGEVALKLAAAPGIVPWQGAIRVAIRDLETREQRLVPFSLASSTEDNGVPGGYTSLLVETTPDLWLTVKAKPAPPSAASAGP